MRATLLLFTLIFCLPVLAQSDPQAYALFDARGKKMKYKKLLRAARAADVVLFGEIHNFGTAQWLQHVLLRDLAAKGPVTLGMEMLETDQQKGLDGYLAGEVSTEQLDEIGAGLWPNFGTAYQPMVDFMRGRGFRVVATNVPRRYARLVYKDGFSALETLPEEERAFLPRLPIPYDASLPGYVRMLEMMPAGHGGETFPMAQAIKDATMADRIVANRSPGQVFLHLNGSYHSDDYEGIGWYLNKFAPDLKVLTITTVEQPSLQELAPEFLNKAHFILVIPSLMVKSN